MALCCTAARLQGGVASASPMRQASGRALQPTTRHPPRRQRRLAVTVTAAASSSQKPFSSKEESFEAFILSLQKRTLAAAEELDGSGARFQHDRWEREGGNAGYGISAVLEGGAVLEKAAANVSVVGGLLSPARAQTMVGRGRDGIDPAGGQRYSAAAMSLVFHSAKPEIPTLRADVRLFEVEGQRWYGGGCDLTPFYVNEDDFRSFHGYWRALCDRHDPQLFPAYKKWADDYFFIPCRQEHRGVGGIFFDDLDAAAAPFDAEQFVRDVGDGILTSWAPIVELRRSAAVTEAQREWQLVRRGRYLEFNLLYDRGVKFGLDGGRVESIMVSAPPLIKWKYNVQPAPGSEEERLVELLRAPREWA